MSILKKSFGFMPDGREVFSYLLDNGKNVKAEIISYGGIVKELWVKNREGEYVDVVLGRDTLEEYFNNDGYFGALIGRHANRIFRGKFNIGEKEYSVGINDGKNSLHGGVLGFNKYVWDVKEINDEKNPAIEMSIVSPDGEEGFPGKLNVTVTYTLSENNGLVINYRAVSDKDTVVNLTNHSYFNLNGAGNDNIYDLDMQMNCGFYTPNTDECMPYGEILSVKGTPFDFTEGKKVGQDINSDYPQLKLFGGYDHNFIIDGKGFRKATVVFSEKTGIAMEVYTDKPGVQLYTGNCIKDDRVCKNGKIYKKHDALCLETQYFPNSTSYAHFPSPILKAGEVYDFTTEYRFITK